MGRLLDDIRSHLIAQSVANTTTWKCYIGYAPDAEDQLISLEVTGGLPQDTHGGETVTQTFQVRIRAGEKAYTTCEDKWWNMFSALENADISISGSDIYLMHAFASGPIVYYDSKQRPNMTANFRVVRATP